MKLLDLRADLLANQGDPAELLPELAAVDRLSPIQRESLDYALGYWVLQVLQRPADTDSLVLLDRLAAYAQQRSDGDTHFSAKLSALRDLLENKRLAVATRASQPSRQLHHAQAILGLLKSETRILQAELTKRLQVSSGRVSQILAVMEQDGLIARERVGQVNWIVDVTAASPTLKAKPTTTTPSESPIRGMDVWLPKRAA